ncbi:hypothetical protein DESUT3_14480 [Desulfuromonas versatilis]|uniref:Citrate synthase n=2 Tax=Desulfuromonas versatilis TaxID=2802975 RepID=A0ABM8HNG9_9BACT|nr:hypothetical protein DESUT3_14480 [Desulfuromonas versatilis]
MIALMNPGPRHPATRAAMNAGVGKTDTVHILPISLSILGGKHLGAGEIEDAMRFFRKMNKSKAEDVYNKILKERVPPNEGDWRPVPGFGSRFGDIDEMPRQFANYLKSLPGAGKSLSWGSKLADTVKPLKIGWLTTGVAAAVFSDLGFHPRDCAGLFQLLSSPGLLAHGLEMAKKPITAMPFLSDEEYKIEKTL